MNTTLPLSELGKVAQKLGLTLRMKVSKTDTVYLLDSPGEYLIEEFSTLSEVQDILAERWDEFCGLQQLVKDVQVLADQYGYFVSGDLDVCKRLFSLKEVRTYLEELNKQEK